MKAAVAALLLLAVATTTVQAQGLFGNANAMRSSPRSGGGGGFGGGGGERWNSRGSSDFGGNRGPNPFDFIKPLVDAASRIPQQPQRNNWGGNRNSRFDDDEYYEQPRYQPQYRDPPVQRNQVAPATVVVPQPVAPAQPVYVPPPKNQVTQRKAQKNANLRYLVSQGFALNGATQTDLRQAVEAADAGGKLDDDIAAQLEKAKTNKINDPATNALDDWKEVVKNGSKPEDVEKFLKDHSDFLKNNDLIRKEVEVRGEIARYQDDLVKGSLTSVGKDQAIASIQTHFGDLRNTPGFDPILAGRINENINGMQQFNDLGKLAEVSVAADDPLGTMIVGVDTAGVPVAIIGDMIGVPVIEGAAVSESAAKRLSKGSILHNPAQNEQQVAYSLNNYPYTMAAGSQQELSEQMALAFDPGNGAVKRYTLGDGVYHWRLTDGLWDIQSVTVKITIDNSESNNEFNYLVNGKDAKILPGEKAVHSDKYPIEIAFDPGNGGKESRKLLTSGTYTVAVDADQGRFNLFRAKAAPPALEVLPAGLTNADPPLPSRGRGKTPQRIEELLKQMKARQNGG